MLVRVTWAPDTRLPLAEVSTDPDTENSDISHMLSPVTVTWWSVLGTVVKTYLLSCSVTTHKVIAMISENVSHSHYTILVT